LIHQIPGNRGRDVKGNRNQFQKIPAKQYGHAGYQSAEHFSDANFFDTVLYHISGEAKEPEAGYDDCQTSKQTNQRSDPLLIAKLFGALLINKTILKRIIVYQQKYEVNGDGRKELIAGIDELIARQENARELLLKGDLMVLSIGK
jgi:hypothetical protein